MVVFPVRLFFYIGVVAKFCPMGDNRTGSTDCRAFGCVPLDKVESVVWIRFWPFDEFGEIKSNVK